MVLASAAMAASATPAYGHASFLESSPRPGARLAQAPAAMTLQFTEPLNARLTEVKLVGLPGDERVPTDARPSGGERLAVRAKRRLDQGAYRVDWRSVSTVDGHVREGSFSFGIGTAAAQGLEVEQSPRWVRVAARVVFYTALFLFVGGVVNAALLGGDGRRATWLLVDPRSPRAGADGDDLDDDDVARRAWRRTVAAGWMATAAAAAMALAEGVDAAGGLEGGDIVNFLLGNAAGLARVGTIAALLLAATAALRSPRVAAALATVALLFVALSGHANSAEPRFAAVPADWVHLIAGGVWVGGIAQVAWAWVPAVGWGWSESQRAVVRTVLPRFGRVALPAFLTVVATGLVNSVIQLGAFDALWRTGYGRVLALKVAVVAGIALASYLHAFRLRPRVAAPAVARPDRSAERRHWRLLGSEPVLGAVVLAAAALLVAIPSPPRELAEADALAATPACNPCPLAKPGPGELAAAEPVADLTAAIWLRRERGALRGTLRLIDRKRQSAKVTARVVGARNQEDCGVGCWRLALPAAARVVEARVDGPAGPARVRIPVEWRTDGNRRARRLLSAAQRAMREAGAMRQVETVQSAHPRGGQAQTTFRFQSPDRMAYDNASSEAIVIGSRMWFRQAGLPWQSSPGAADGTKPYRADNRFRWTVFADSARLLGVQRYRGRRVAEISILDYGYPVWYRMRVDLATKRVLTARLLTPENRINHRYFDFGKSADIRPPRPVLGD